MEAGEKVEKREASAQTDLDMQNWDRVAGNKSDSRGSEVKKVSS